MFYPQLCLQRPQTLAFNDARSKFVNFIGEEQNSFKRLIINYFRVD